VGPYHSSLPEPLAVNCSHAFRKKNTFLDYYPTLLLYIQYTAWPRISNQERMYQSFISGGRKRRNKKKIKGNVNYSSPSGSQNIE